MTEDCPPVKSKWEHKRTEFICWIDSHSRIGWYICILAVINTILNLLDLFGAHC